jgi:hypothetical protein
MRALRRLAWLLLPSLLAALPLLVGQQQEGGDAPDKTAGDDADADAATTARSSLAIVKQPRASLLQQEEKLRDAPFVVARRDGQVTVGWIEYSSGRGDQLTLLTAPPDQLALPKPALIRVGATMGALLRPVALADREDRLHLYWTELIDGVGQLRASDEQAGGSWSEPRSLTGGAWVRMNSDATLAADGRIWLAWEGEEPGKDGGKPQRDVWAAPMGDDGQLGEATRVGDGAWSDLDARIVAAGEQLWIAWASFTGRDYEIRLRSLDPKSRALGATQDVSARSDADDLHPALAAAPDGALWVAWDSAANPLRGDSTPPQLRRDRRRVDVEVAVRCARVSGSEITLPDARSTGIDAGVVEGALGLSIAGGLPRLVVAPDGRPWIAYRQLVAKPNSKSHGWSVLLQPLEAAGWGAPLEVETSLSTLCEPALALAGDRVVAAFTSDRRMDRGASNQPPPGFFADPLRKQGVTFDVWRGPFGIGVALPKSPAEPFTLPPRSARTERLATPHFHPAGDALADPLISGARHYEIVRGEQRFQVYWGDLHRHSCISRCSAGFEPTPTDHSGQINPLAWWQIDKLTQLYRSPGFATLAGYEWSTREWGHHNVILPGRMTPFVGEISDLDELFDRLPDGEAVTIPHHPADNSFANDFTKCDDRFTRLIEIFQARRGNFEFDGCFKQAPNAGSLGSFVQDALQQGHQYGIIASSDHAEGQAYACVLAESLSPRALFDAMKARRTYGATTKGMVIDLRVDDALMGEAITTADPRRVRVMAHGAKELCEVVVFRGGRPWQRVGPPPSDEWNRFAPLRLQARFVAGGAPLADEVTVSARLVGSRFHGMQENRLWSRRNPVPQWSASGANATLRCPKGFVAQPFLRDFPIHLQGELDDPLELALPDGVRKLTLRELRKAPVVATLPGGATCTVSLELGDGALPFEQGMGTRDYTGEWIDDDVKPGKAWYYARVIQVDGEIAWSSPIFVSVP